MLEAPPVYEVRPDEVENAKLWINAGFARPRKTLNRNISSYGLKHLAENYAGKYISNLALVQAMIESGFRAKLVRLTPNYIFNVQLRKV